MKCENDEKEILIRKNDFNVTNGTRISNMNFGLYYNTNSKFLNWRSIILDYKNALITCIYLLDMSTKLVSWINNGLNDFF